MKPLFTLLTLWCCCAPVCLQGQSTTKTYRTFTDSTSAVGDVILAPKIFFTLSGGMRVIREHYDSLQVIVDFLRRYPNIVIELGVHSDDRGSDESNMRLSEWRGGSVKNVLVAHFNIPPDRIVVKGYGESDPIIAIEEIQREPEQGRKEELYSINRRIEVKILGE